MQKKKGRGKGRKSAVKTEVEGEAEPAAEAHIAKTPKPKRKRSSSSTAHLVQQEGWPVQPRTLWPLPEGFALSRSAMKSIVKEVSGSDYASPFLEPVDPDEAPGYLDMIKQPMDIGTWLGSLRTGSHAHL